MHCEKTNSSEGRDQSIIGNALVTIYAPMILKFFGPQMVLAYRLDAISQGQKNSKIPGPNRLPLALVMDMHAFKTLCTGLYKS
jgi:hypothetical protein